MTDDWRKVGTRVIIVTHGGTGTELHHPAQVSTIERVSVKTFRVSGQDNPFSMIGNTTKRIGGPWGHTKICLPLESKEGQREYAAMQKRRIINRVNAHARHFTVSNNRDDLLKLREAVNMALEVVTE